MKKVRANNGKDGGKKMDTDNTERRTRTSTTWRASRHMGWVVHDLD
jgi:hypothetical protein